MAQPGKYQDYDSMSVTELRNAVKELHSYATQLQADNTLLKVSVNSLVSRVEEIEEKGVRGSSSKRSRSHNSRKAKASRSGASLYDEDDEDLPPPAPSGGTSAKKKKKRSSSRRPESAGSTAAGSTADGSTAAPRDLESRLSSYYLGKKKIHVVAPPSFHEKKNNAKKPSQELRLEYVYGYNGKRCRGNLYFTNSTPPKLVYNIAGAGVTLDPESNQQKFFLGHDEDITCLAIGPKNYVATGQMDPKGQAQPYVCVWDADNCRTVAKFADYHDRQVQAVAISPDGHFLFSIGGDDNHTLAAWDMKVLMRPVAHVTCCKEDVAGMTINPYSSDGYEFVTFGTRLIKRWNPQEQKGGKARAIDLGQGSILAFFQQTQVMQKGFYCALYLPPDVFQPSSSAAPGTQLVVGTATGDLYITQGQALIKTVKAHSKSVGGLCLTADGFASGGKDGKVVLWGPGFVKLSEISVDGKVRALAYTPNVRGLAVGTSNNDIFMCHPDRSTPPKALVEGHSGEIWGLAVHPEQPVFATGANDKSLRMWNYDTRSAVPGKVYEARTFVRSAAFSPDGQHLALGLQNGKAVVLHYDSFEVKYERKHMKEQIDAIAFSPNGQVLALGSWDQNVELIDMESYSSIRLEGHTSSVTHLTFSHDSKYLMSNSRDYEILYWDCETGQQETSRGKIADVVWENYTNILGWPVQGIFAKGMDGTDINAVHISGEDTDANRLIAAGNDFGKVLLWRYPCLAPTHKARKYGGHSAHVTNVRFSPDCERLFSTGGGDFGVFQWGVR